MPAADQRRPTPIDQLNRLTPRWDDLVRRASLVTRQADVDDVDELLLAFIHDLTAIHRRTLPSRAKAAPLRMAADRQSGIW